MIRSIMASILSLVGLTTSAASKTYEQAEIYRDLRSQVLGLSAENSEPRNGLFAVIMETGYDEAAATVLATSEGGASVYFSSGGGIIGAGNHDQVRDVIFETFVEAPKYLSQFKATKTYPLPQPGETRFYIVSDGEVLTAEASENALGEERHELSPLFHQMQKLIWQIDLV